MAAHPAGKGRDDQSGIADFLRDVVVPQLDPFDEEVYEVMAGLAALLISKQADYGPDAINRSPGGALNGINVRMHDKLSRVINLTAPPAISETSARYESVRDTYRDIANYAVIAVMVLDGTWPS